MDITTIATFAGVALAWFALTIRNSAGKMPAQVIDHQKRVRRAQMIEPSTTTDKAVRNSIDAILTNAKISEHLLTRVETMEQKQLEHDSLILDYDKRIEAQEVITNQKLTDMQKKVEYLTNENNSKTRKIVRLQKEVLALKTFLQEQGHVITSAQLDILIQNMPDDVTTRSPKNQHD